MIACEMPHGSDRYQRLKSLVTKYPQQLGLGAIVQCQDQAGELGLSEEQSAWFERAKAECNRIPDPTLQKFARQVYHLPKD